MTGEERDLLDARARRLADPGALGRAAAGSIRVLCLRIEGQRYGVPVGSLLAALAAPALTPLPGLPPSILGVLHHQGCVASVLDLAALVRGVAPSPRAFVTLVEAEAGALGLFADEIEGFRDLDPAELAPALDAAGPVRWTSNDLLQILDIAWLFASPALLGGERAAPRPAPPGAPA